MIDTFSHPLPADIRRLATAVMRRACERQVMLSVAESCTGGLLAAVLTDVEGCAHVFERGFVTYTAQSKQDMLGVPKALIEAHGVVSPEVAAAMARGALRGSQAGLALAITGYAGEGGPGEEPGLVCFGLARPGRTGRAKTCRYRDADRAGVRRESLRTALAMLDAALVGKSP